MPVVLFALVAAILAVLVYWAWLEEKKRREALKALAAKLGFRYWENDPDGLAGRFDFLTGFNQGHSRKALNVMKGRTGDREVLLFDFQYKVTTTDSKGRSHTTTYYFSAVTLELPFRSTELFIRDEGLLDKLASFIGFDDIDFESDEFSRKFCVKCNDKRFAYDVIHPRMMEFLMQNRGLSYEMEHDVLCIRTGGRWSAAEFESRLRLAEQFVAHIPEFLARQMKEREL